MSSSASVANALSWARANTDALFGVVRPDSLYDRPIPERHRIVFYIGHLEAFDWNLLREPLELHHVKPRLLGHFGTVPGLNLIYAHLNRAIVRYLRGDDARAQADVATCVALGHRRARLPLAAARPPQSTPAPEARSIRDYDAANLALRGILKESTDGFVCFFTAPDGKGYWLRRGDRVRNGQLTDVGPRSVQWSLNDGKSVEVSIP